jgi:SAM-dependent methyltransferase
MTTPTPPPELLAPEAIGPASPPAPNRRSRPDSRTHAERLSRFYTTRFLRSYVYWKVRTDPLYPAAAQALASGQGHPLVDLGCGAGLFAFYLKSRAHHGPIHGLDVDHDKVRAAQAIAKTHWQDVSFAAGDFANWNPSAHQGHVTLLDVLQYLPYPQQQNLLQKAAGCLTEPGHRLIIRNGLADGSWRASITRLTDHFARWIGWMPRSPLYHPTRNFIEGTLSETGLSLAFTPLWGATPFNNYLIVAQRPA